MERTKQYSVGNETVDVADSNNQRFQNDVAANGDQAEEITNYRVKIAKTGQVENVPVHASKLAQFKADIEANGDSAQQIHRVRMDDGKDLDIGEEDMRQLVQAQRTGVGVSRQMLKNTGIPEEYARSAADRAKLAEQLGAMYFPVEQEQVNTPHAVSPTEPLVNGARAVGSAVARAGNEVVMGPGSATREWMERGAANGEFIPMAVKQMNANAGQMVSGVVGAAGKALGGASNPIGRAVLGAAGKINTEAPQYETGMGGTMNSIVNGANQVVNGVAPTIFKYSIPGVAAVDISYDAAQSYYDARNEALKNGLDEGKANALATAKAGLNAVEGIILANSAVGKGGFKGFIGRIGEMGGKMFATGAAKDVVQQGIEGAENPDLARAGKAGLKAGAEGVAFEAVGSGLKKGAAAGDAKAAAETRKSVEEFNKSKELNRKANEAAKEVEEYRKSNLGEEAKAEIHAMVRQQVEAGTISEAQAAKVEELAQRNVAGKLVVERKDATQGEYRQQAVWDAIDEANAPEVAKAERREASIKKQKEVEAEKARAKAESEAYEKAEAERKAREKAEEENAPEVGEEEAAREAEQAKARAEVENNQPTDERDAQWPEYQNWLAHHKGRVDGPKNWNKFVMENGLDPALKVDTKDTEGYNKMREDIEARRAGRGEKPKRPPYDAAEQASQAEMGKRIEEQFPGARNKEGTAGRGAAPVAEPVKSEAKESEAEAPKAETPKAEKPAAEAASPDIKAEEPKKTEVANKKLGGVTKPQKHNLVKITSEDRGRSEVFIDDNGTVRTVERFDNSTQGPGFRIHTITKEGQHTDEFVKELPENLGDKFDAKAVIGDYKAPKKAKKVPDGKGKMVVKTAEKPVEEAKEPQKQGENGQYTEARRREITDNMVKAMHTVGIEYGARPERDIKAKIAELSKHRNEPRVQEQIDAYNAILEYRKMNDARRAEIEAQKKAREAEAGAQAEPSASGAKTEEPAKAEEAPKAEVKVPDGKGKMVRREAAPEAEPAKGEAKKPAKKPTAKKTAKPVEAAGYTDANGELTESGRKALEETEVGHAIVGNYDANVKDDKPFAIKQLKRAIEANKEELAGGRGMKAKKRAGKRGAKEEGVLMSVRNEEPSEVGGEDGRMLSLSTPNGTDFPHPNLKATDPKYRSEKKILDWAHKNGRTTSHADVTIDGVKQNVELATPETVRDYYKTQTEEAAKATRRWFPDLKVYTHEFGRGIKRGVHTYGLVDKSGNTLGWFSPSEKEVHLLPGADPDTVAHEIMWHGTKHWARQQAADPKSPYRKHAMKLLKQMHQLELDADPAIKAIVKRNYKRLKGYSQNPSMIFEEFGAWGIEKEGGKALEELVKSKDGERLFARYLSLTKDLYKDFLTAHGYNRVDLGEIDGMTSDQLRDWMIKQFVGGKTLGEINPASKKLLSTKERWFQKKKRVVYDVAAPLRKLESDLEKRIGRKLTFNESVDAENALTPGLREAALIENQKAQKELAKLLGEAGLHYKELESYIAYRAAADRDKKIDEKNKEKIREAVEAKVLREWGTDKALADQNGFKAAVDAETKLALSEYKTTNGSHVDLKEAANMVAEMENGEHGQAFKDAADLLRKVINDTLETQRKGGLISDELADKLNKEEPEYVPFKNEYDQETGEWLGRGVNNFSAGEFHEAEGRESSAGDIIAHIFQDNLSAHQRVIENNVRKKLAHLVRMAPELGEIKGYAGGKNLQKKLSDSADEGNTSGMPDVVTFKEGGDSYIIRLNGTRGSAIAAAITERNTKHIGTGKFSKGFEAVTRFSAGLATRFDQTFAFRNLVKDNIELSNIVFTEKGPVEGAKWMKNYIKGQKENFGGIRHYLMTGEIDNSAGGQMLKKYIEAGGLISGGATEGLSKIVERLDPKAIQKEMAKGKSKTQAALESTKRAFMFMSEASELTTRLNVFAAELASGKSAKEAALYSRRATVDFNRHGEMTGVTNVLRMFSNSTLGATARATASLAKSKYGLAMLGANMANGALQVVLEHMMNDDEDKEREKHGEATGKDISEYERKTSLVLIRMGNKSFKIPQHESPFALAGYAGNLIARVCYGDITAEKAAKELGVSTTELAITLTGWGSVNLRSSKEGIGSDALATIVSASPSMLQPLAEIGFDMDYKGDPIFKKTISDYDVKSDRAKTHTQEYAKATAKWLNELSGGNEARTSELDAHPEAIQTLAEGYGKGVFKEAMMAVELMKAFKDGKLKDVGVKNVPVVRDFAKENDGNTGRYYDAIDEYNKDVKEFGERTSWASNEEKVEYFKAHPWLRKSGRTGRRTIDMLIDGSTNNGVHTPGINDLAKMEQDKVRTKSGKYVDVKKPYTDEQKKAFHSRRLKMQQRVLEIMKRDK